MVQLHSNLISTVILTLSALCEGEGSLALRHKVLPRGILTAPPGTTVVQTAP